MKATIKQNYANTYHRDGTVSYWNVRQQRWEREAAGAMRAEMLASMSADERIRIARWAQKRLVAQGKTVKAVIIIRHKDEEDTFFVKEVSSHKDVSDVLCGLGDVVAICPDFGEFYGWGYSQHSGYYTYHEAANASDLQWARECIAQAD